MAKSILRKLLTPFGGAGATTNFAQFGSKKAGSPIKSKDILTIQSLAAWANGFQDAVLTGDHPAFLEDINSLFYVKSYMLAYLFQEGVPEWDAGQSYYVGSMCRRPGTNEIYQSLTDDNLGNVLPVKTNNTFWMWFNEPPIKAGMGQQWFGATLPAQGRWLFQDGSAVSRATYSDLFAVIGTIYGAGNGSTTFNLPDARSRIPMGAGTGAGLSTRALGTKLGLETHNHPIGTHQHKTSTLRRTSDSSLIVPKVGPFGEGDVSIDATGGAGFGAGAANNPNKAHLTDNPEAGAVTGDANLIPPVYVCNWIIAY